MIPVAQTVRGEFGNCFGSCMAAIFELPLAEMPDYFQGIPDNPAWLNVWREWLAVRGLGVFVRDYCCDSCSVPSGYYILSVECSHHPDSHAVVCLNGEIVHDPLPGKLCPEVVKRHCYIFTILDPSQLKDFNR